MADAQAVGAQFVEAFNGHDGARIRELNAENGVFEAPGDVHLEGGAAAADYAISWFTAFPDARLNVHNVLSAGDWVVQELTFEGTHEAPLQTPMGEVPATGRSLIGRAVQIFKVEGDAIVDTRLYFDQVQVMTQLGLTPEPATA
jgi:steroid delta-isomerase-like uncharacterized protein